MHNALLFVEHLFLEGGIHSIWIISWHRVRKREATNQVGESSGVQDLRCT